MATDTATEIKERLSIQDIISPYVKLSRAGKSLRGLCPFHKEKTPSFHVSPERGTWHCFGCGLGGDGFSFIEKIEGVDFKGSLKILAEKAGVELKSGFDSASRSHAERLREALSRASEWYAGRLSGSPAHAYAVQRGLRDETLAQWRIGYAPPAWRELLTALSSEGFTVAELAEAGLVKEADGKRGTFYDRFRNRLMFPIRDTAGRVVGFTGRTIPSPKPEPEGSEPEPAKYLNSPETELYRKSEILFGMDTAKDAIRVRGFGILVEGQMDVLLAHQAGFSNVVALSGTALSEKHIAIFKRYSGNLMLVLDADKAGLAATAKSAALALRNGLQVKAARLPKGKDPADLVADDPKSFSRCIASAESIIEFFLAELTESERDPHRLLRVVEQTVLPLISAIQSPMEREHFIQITARALGLSSETVGESLRKSSGSVSAKIPQRYDVSPATVARSSRDIRSEQLLAVFHAYPDTPLAHRIESEYCRITEAHQFPLDTPPESALFMAEQTFGADPHEDAADELLRAFEEAVVREAYQQAVGTLRMAETGRDASAIEDAQAACAKLSTRLAALGR